MVLISREEDESASSVLEIRVHAALRYFHRIGLRLYESPQSCSEWNLRFTSSCWERERTGNCLWTDDDNNNADEDDDGRKSLEIVRCGTVNRQKSKQKCENSNQQRQKEKIK